MRKRNWQFRGQPGCRASTVRQAFGCPKGDSLARGSAPSRLVTAARWWHSEPRSSSRQCGAVSTDGRCPLVESDVARRRAQQSVFLHRKRQRKTKTPAKEGGAALSRYRSFLSGSRSTLKGKQGGEVFRGMGRVYRATNPEDVESIQARCVGHGGVPAFLAGSHCIRDHFEAGLKPASK
jgi:hypothetical protein